VIRRAVILGVLVAAGAFLAYLAKLVRDEVSPTEPYAASIGLTPDQCVAVQGGLSEAQARAACERRVPKRR
jgi:hypothetical protein